MSNLVAIQDKNIQAVEAALVKNDISKLGDAERMAYYKSVCDSVGLNPMTKPFAFLTLQGKTVLYATKDCTEQLRKIHGVSTQIVSVGVSGDFMECHVKAADRTGRQDEDFASIPLNGAKGADLSNLKMKCVTKAKRRVTLSICGLGILDESEIDTLQGQFNPTSNPQIESPFKNNPSEPVQLVQPENDLGEFVCNVGKKFPGQKLKDIDIFALDDYVKKTRQWFIDEKKQMSQAWVTFFDTAEAFLCSREVPSSVDMTEPLE